MVSLYFHRAHGMLIYNIHLCVRSIVPRSTYYRSIGKLTTSSRDVLKNKLSHPGTISIHWFDNFARTFARQNIYLDRDQFVSMLWTAHGVKVWPGQSPVTMSYVYNGDIPIRAMPPLSFIISDVMISSVLDEMTLLSIHFQPNALSEHRHVRRVPLKPPPMTIDEKDHMAQSLDGLSCFEPIDIYNVNIQSYDGLLRSLLNGQKIEGFGLIGGNKDDEYSSILLDVSTFWMAFRLLYSFTGLSPILHDLFLFLGPWHNYMYSHVCVWSEFRSSFLASAYFTLFPKQNLFFRPRLLVSSTFFTWMRAAYPSFRGQLLSSLNTLKHLSLIYDVQYTINLKQKTVLKRNPFRYRYIQLLNLMYLFEYVLPTIADYGSALKLNDWNAFKGAYLRLFRFFLCAKSQGTFLCRSFVGRCCLVYPCDVCFLLYNEILGR